MSNALTNQLETKSYTLFISSADKISGTNNQATFNINWDDFLPKEYDTYKMTFSFQTGGGYYADTTFASTNSSMTNNGTVLSVTAVTSGTITAGQVISGSTAIQSNTYILSQASGTAGGVGTYNVSKPFTSTIANTTVNGQINYSGCKIVMDTQGRGYSFDTATLSKSNTLGFAQRDLASTTSTSNSYSTFYLQFAPKTISRPNQNLVTFSFYNLNNNFLLCDTDKTGIVKTDMTNWNLILEFIPVQSSINALDKEGLNSSGKGKSFQHSGV